MFCKGIVRLLLLLSLAVFSVIGQAAEDNDYRLGAGDTMRIVVFQNPDLTTEVRVSESGVISFPLLGSVELGGLTVTAAEKKIADMLKEGKFVQQPQVNIVLTQIRGNQVSVLGQVNRPGRYPLETFNTHLSDVLALSGGATGVRFRHRNFDRHSKRTNPSGKKSIFPVCFWMTSAKTMFW